jgi:plastocyanin
MLAVRRSRLIPLTLLAGVALALSACAGSGSPAWTYAPQPSITPPPSPTAAASGAPSGAPSSAPTAAPSAGGSAAPSASGGGTGATLDVTAQNIAFSTVSLETAAGQAFTINFDNEDAGIPHNIEIKDANGNSAFKGDIITGVAKATYAVPALTAGTYSYICDVHPNMVGSLVVH